MDRIVTVGSIAEPRNQPVMELAGGASSVSHDMEQRTSAATSVGSSVRSAAYLGADTGESPRSDRTDTAALAWRRRSFVAMRSLRNAGRRVSSGLALGSRRADDASTSDSETLKSEDTDDEEAELNARLQQAMGAADNASDNSSHHSRESAGTAAAAAMATVAAMAAAEGPRPPMYDDLSSVKSDDVAPLAAEVNAAVHTLERKASEKSELSVKTPRRRSLQDGATRRQSLTRQMDAQARFLAIVTHAMDADVRSTPSCMYSHIDSKILMAWDIVVAVLVIYVAIFSPLEIAFTPVVSSIAGTVSNEDTFLRIPPLVWFFLNFAISVVWLLDIMLQFRVTFPRPKDGLPEYDAYKIAVKYLTSWFALDVIATVPWDLLLLALAGMSSNPAPGLLARAPKIARVLRIPRVLKVARFYRVWRKWNPKALAMIKFSWMRTISAMLIVAVVVHWMACGFFLLHEVQGKVENTFVEKINDITEDSEWRLEELYIATLYWSVMTLTTIGYGDIAPENTGERVYTICTMFVGAVLFSFILSEIATLLESVRWRTSAFKARVDSVSAYMERKSLPKWLRRKCNDFLFEAHAQGSMGTLAGWGLPAGLGVEARPPNGITLGTGGGVEGALLWLFSPYLRNMIGFQVFKPFFERTPAFSSLSPDFLGRLAMELVPVAYGVREYVFVVGDASTCMFFLATGCVFVLLYMCGCGPPPPLLFLSLSCSRPPPHPALVPRNNNTAASSGKCGVKTRLSRTSHCSVRPNALGTKAASRCRRQGFAPLSERGANQCER